MARAIKSILANRKLFQGGGLVPPGNPMQNLNQANGILASSQPLINSVVSDAVNPQGGRTLSMDSGGIAKFQGGGLGAMGNAPPSMTQLAGSEQLGAIEPLQQSALRDMARVQQAKQAFHSGQITREQLNKVQDEVIAKYGSVQNLERLLPRSVVAEAEAPVHLTSPTSALPPTPSRSVEELQSSPIPTELTVPPAPQVISEQILEEKVPIAEKPGTGKRFFKKMLPDETIGAWLDRYNKLGTPEKHDPAADYGLWTEDQNAVWVPRTSLSSQEATDQMKKERWLEKHPNMTSAEYDAQLNEIPLADEVIDEVTQEAEPPEAITPVKEEIPSLITPIVHPDTLAKDVTPEEYAGRSELQQRKAKKIRGDFEVTGDQRPLTRYLAEAGKVKSDEDTPSAVLGNSIDAIIADAVAASKGEKFNKEAFAQEIEAMLPEVEDDPELEGYLIMLMGASIMAGKDPNALVNIGAGLEKSLPAFINFKAKKKEAERERKSTAAKISIETMLSRETEDRATIRNIRAIGTQAQIDLTMDALEPKDWFVAEAALIPAIDMGGSADDPALVVPRTTTLRLNDAGMQRATELGLKLLPWGSGSWTLDDVITGTPTTAETVKALNELGKETNTKVFADFVKNPMTINYTTPRSGALHEGSQVTNMININDLDAFYREYDRVRMPTKGLIKDIGIIQGLVLDNPEAFSGTGLVADQIADSLRALKGIGVAQDAVKWLEDTMGATKVLGAQKQAQTRALIVMAKIAPMLLDESGKTISDADRRMIAETLGLTVFDREDKSFSVKLDAKMFRNPANIVLALNQTQAALATRLNEVNAAGRAHLSQFGVPNIGLKKDREKYIKLEEQRRTLEATEETPEASGKNIFDIKASDLTFNFVT